MKKYEGDAAAQKPCYYFLKLFNPPRCPPDQVNVSIFYGIIPHAFWICFSTEISMVLSTQIQMFNTAIGCSSLYYRLPNGTSSARRAFSPGISERSSLCSASGRSLACGVCPACHSPNMLQSANGRRHLTCYFVSVSMIISCADHATLLE